MTMRTRTRDNTSFVGSTTSGTDSSNNESSHSCVTGSVSESLAFPYPIGELETMTDHVVPHFHKRIAAGEVINNAMSKSKTRRSVSFSTRSYNVNWKSTDAAAHRHCAYKYAQSIDGSFFCLNEAGAPVGHLSLDGVSEKRLRELAGTDANAGIETSQFEGATFVAELRETIGFLVNPMGNFVKKLEGYKRSKLARKHLNHQTVADYISSNWLRYRYGIRPLVYDIQNAAEAVAQTVHGHIPERRTSRGSASTSGSQSQSGSIGAYCSYDTHTSGSTKVRAGVLYQASRSPDTFGVGAPEIPGALWEAIPFSFVVDWFANVGTFVDAISPKGGITRLASWTSVEKELTTTRSIRWVNGGNYGTGYPRNITSDGTVLEEYETTTKQRSPGTDIGLNLEILPLGGDLGKKRIADLVAIGFQILKSKGDSFN